MINLKKIAIIYPIALAAMAFLASIAGVGITYTSIQNLALVTQVLQNPLLYFAALVVALLVSFNKEILNILAAVFAIIAIIPTSINAATHLTTEAGEKANNLISNGVQPVCEITTTQEIVRLEKTGENYTVYTNAADGLFATNKYLDAETYKPLPEKIVFNDDFPQYNTKYYVTRPNDVGKPDIINKSICEYRDGDTALRWYTVYDIVTNQK